MNKRKMRLLIVDDERDLLILLRKVLSRKCDCEIILAESPSEAKKIILEWKPDVVLTDIIMQESDGLQLLQFINETDSSISTIIMTGYGTVKMAVRALKNGAYDFFEKPFDNDKISRVVQRAMERTRLLRENITLQQQLVINCGATELVGNSQAMRQTIDLLTRFGQSDATVLIRGESGTGKELAARAVHAASSRATRRMVTVNCPALPEQILESELFGYAKGAFTGADSDKDGLFLEAEGSTLLLDEIADIPVSIQTKLLRVLQEKEIQPLGQTRTIKVDVRVLASTNQNLEEKIANGEFRGDLYYRLNVMNVTLPSLSERREDIPLLAHHFLRMYEEEYGREGMSFSQETMQSLLSMEWPGNVRELQNCINRAVLLAPEALISVEDLRSDGVVETGLASPAAPDGHEIDPHLPFKLAKQEVVDNFSIAYLQNHLRRTMGNVSAAAKNSGMERQAFQRLMRRYGIQSATFRQQSGADDDINLKVS